ncbi:c-type cytochrome [Bacteriovorax sp. DB6_IX]|uniref:c-type cytochrome n=1 Tax=Bacteriovorax sp. DB6_IX TaxID=1353530 RepID=UPI00038A47FC|nr:c-type cytochrome [Bacteriovorax sp. DB6_IX]EQC50490.1 cytochrome C [Bacteriovorax sp. DB6_IX]
MKKFFTLMALFAITASSQAGDIANGKKIYKKINCTMCHNANGSGKASDVSKIRMTKGPKIAGLDAAYVAEQVIAVQSKKRKTKNTAMMYAKVKKLSKKEIADVAAYVASLGPKYKGMFQK